MSDDAILIGGKRDLTVDTASGLIVPRSALPPKVRTLRHDEFVRLRRAVRGAVKDHGLVFVVLCQDCGKVAQFLVDRIMVPVRNRQTGELEEANTGAVATVALRCDCTEWRVR